jgi:hypothetical protein
MAFIFSRKAAQFFFRERVVGYLDTEVKKLTSLARHGGAHSSNHIRSTGSICIPNRAVRNFIWKPNGLEES